MELLCQILCTAPLCSQPIPGSQAQSAALLASRFTAIRCMKFLEESWESEQLLVLEPSGKNIAVAADVCSCAFIKSILCNLPLISGTCHFTFHILCDFRLTTLTGTSLAKATSDVGTTHTRKANAEKARNAPKAGKVQYPWEKHGEP